MKTEESIEASSDIGEFHCNVTKLCDWCYFKKSGDCPAFMKLFCCRRGCRIGGRSVDLIGMTVYDESTVNGNPPEHFRQILEHFGCS